MIGKMRHTRLFKLMAMRVVWVFFVTTTFQGISYADISGASSFRNLSINSRLQGDTITEDDNPAVPPALGPDDLRDAAEELNHEDAFDKDRAAELAGQAKVAEARAKKGPYFDEEGRLLLFVKAKRRKTGAPTAVHSSPHCLLLGKVEVEALPQELVRAGDVGDFTSCGRCRTPYESQWLGIERQYSHKYKLEHVWRGSPVALLEEAVVKAEHRYRTVEELVEDLGIAASTAKQDLKLLFDAGLLKRERRRNEETGGYEYVYKLATPRELPRERLDVARRFLDGLFDQLSPATRGNVTKFRSGEGRRYLIVALQDIVRLTSGRVHRIRDEGSLKAYYVVDDSLFSILTEDPGLDALEIPEPRMVRPPIREEFINFVIRFAEENDIPELRETAEIVRRGNAVFLKASGVSDPRILKPGKREVLSYKLGTRTREGFATELMWHEAIHLELIALENAQPDAWAEIVDMIGRSRSEAIAEVRAIVEDVYGYVEGSKRNAHELLTHLLTVPRYSEEVESIISDRRIFSPEAAESILEIYNKTRPAAAAIDQVIAQAEEMSTQLEPRDYATMVKRAMGIVIRPFEEPEEHLLPDIPASSPANALRVARNRASMTRFRTISFLTPEGVSNDTVRSHLMLLLKAGLLERKGEGDTATYRVRPESELPRERLEAAQACLNWFFDRNAPVGKGALTAYRSGEGREKLITVLKDIVEPSGLIRKAGREGQDDAYVLADPLFSLFSYGAPAGQVGVTVYDRSDPKYAFTERVVLSVIAAAAEQGLPGAGELMGIVARGRALFLKASRMSDAERHVPHVGALPDSPILDRDTRDYAKSKLWHERIHLATAHFDTAAWLRVADAISETENRHMFNESMMVEVATGLKRGTAGHALETLAYALTRWRDPAETRRIIRKTFPKDLRETILDIWNRTRPSEKDVNRVVRQAEELREYDEQPGYLEPAVRGMAKAAVELEEERRVALHNRPTGPRALDRFLQDNAETIFQLEMNNKKAKRHRVGGKITRLREVLEKTMDACGMRDFLGNLESMVVEGERKKVRLQVCVVDELPTFLEEGAEQAVVVEGHASTRNITVIVRKKDLDDSAAIAATVARFFHEIRARSSLARERFEQADFGTDMEQIRARTKKLREDFERENQELEEIVRQLAEAVLSGRDIGREKRNIKRRKRILEFAGLKFDKKLSPLGRDLTAAVPGDLPVSERECAVFLEQLIDAGDMLDRFARKVAGEDLLTALERLGWMEHDGDAGVYRATRALLEGKAEILAGLRDDRLVQTDRTDDEDRDWAEPSADGEPIREAKVEYDASADEKEGPTKGERGSMFRRVGPLDEEQRRQLTGKRPEAPAKRGETDEAVRAALRAEADLTARRKPWYSDVKPTLKDSGAAQAQPGDMIAPAGRPDMIILATDEAGVHYISIEAGADQRRTISAAEFETILSADFAAYRVDDSDEAISRNAGVLPLGDDMRDRFEGVPDRIYARFVEEPPAGYRAITCVMDPDGNILTGKGGSVLRSDLEIGNIERKLDRGELHHFVLYCKVNRDVAGPHYILRSAGEAWLKKPPSAVAVQRLARSIEAADELSQARDRQRAAIKDEPVAAGEDMRARVGGLYGKRLAEPAEITAEIKINRTGLAMGDVVVSRSGTERVVLRLEGDSAVCFERRDEGNDVAPIDTEGLVAHVKGGEVRGAVPHVYRFGPDDDVGESNVDINALEQALRGRAAARGFSYAGGLMGDDGRVVAGSYYASIEDLAAADPALHRRWQSGRLHWFSIRVRPIDPANLENPLYEVDGIGADHRDRNSTPVIAAQRLVAAVERAGRRYRETALAGVQRNTCLIRALVREMHGNTRGAIEILQRAESARMSVPTSRIFLLEEQEYEGTPERAREQTTLYQAVASLADAARQLDPDLHRTYFAETSRETIQMLRESDDARIALTGKRHAMTDLAVELPEFREIQADNRGELKIDNDTLQQIREAFVEGDRKILDDALRALEGPDDPFGYNLFMLESLRSIFELTRGDPDLREEFSRTLQDHQDLSFLVTARDKLRGAQSARYLPENSIAADSSYLDILQSILDIEEMSTATGLTRGEIRTVINHLLSERLFIHELSHKELPREELLAALDMTEDEAEGLSDQQLEELRVFRIERRFLKATRERLGENIDAFFDFLSQPKYRDAYKAFITAKRRYSALVESARTDSDKPLLTFLKETYAADQPADRLAMAGAGDLGDWAGFDEADREFLQQAAELAGNFIHLKGHQPSISEMVPLLMKVTPDFTMADNKGAALAVKFKNCAKRKVERAGGDVQAKEERIEAEYDGLLAKLRVSKGPGGPGTVKAEQRLGRMRAKADELEGKLETRRPTIAETARALKEDGTDFVRSKNPAQAAYRWLKKHAEREDIDYDELIDDYLDLARGPVSGDQLPPGSFYSVFKVLLDSDEPLTLTQITDRVNAEVREGARQVSSATVRRDLGTLGQRGRFRIVYSREERDARVFFPTEEARLSGTQILNNILRPIGASRRPVDLDMAQRDIERALRRARQVVPPVDITGQLQREMTSLRPGDRVVISGREAVVLRVDDDGISFIPVANWDSSDDTDYPDYISVGEFTSGLANADITVYRVDANDEIVAASAGVIADGFGTSYTSGLFSFMREEVEAEMVILDAIIDSDGRIMVIGTDLGHDNARLSGHIRTRLEESELYELTLAVIGEHRGRTGRPYCRVHDVQNAPARKVPPLALQRVAEAVNTVDRQYAARRMEDAELMPDDTRLIVATFIILQDDGSMAQEAAFEVLANREDEQDISADMAARFLEMVEEIQAAMALPETQAIRAMPRCRLFRALYELAMLVEEQEGVGGSSRELLLRSYFRGGHASSASLVSTDRSRLALTKLAAPTLPPAGTDGSIISGMPSWLQRRNWIRRANKGDAGALSSLVGHIEVDYVGSPPLDRSQAVDAVAKDLKSPYREKFLVRVDPQIRDVTAGIAGDSRQLKTGDRIVTPDGVERIITHVGSNNLRYISTAQGAHGQRVSSYERCDRKLADDTRVYRFDAIDEGIQHNVKLLPRAEGIQSAWDMHGIDMPAWSTVEGDEGGHVVARCAMDTDGFILPLSHKIQAHDEGVVDGEVFLIDVDYKKFPTGDMREPHYRLNAVEHFHGRTPSGVAIQRAFYSLQVAGRWSQAESRRKAELCSIERYLIAAAVLQMRGRQTEAMETLEGYADGRYPAISNAMAKEFRGALVNYWKADRGVHAATREIDSLHIALEALRQGLIGNSSDPKKGEIYALFFEVPNSAFATLVLGRSPEEPEIDDVPERIACALDKEIAKMPPHGTDGNVMAGGLNWLQRKTIIPRNIRQANRGDEAAFDFLVGYIAEDFVTRPDERPREIAGIGRRLNSPHREKFLAQVNPRSIDVTSTVNNAGDLLPGDRIVTTEDMEMVVLHVDERYAHHIRDSVGDNTRSILSRVILNGLLRQGAATTYRFEGDDEIVRRSAGILPQGLDNQEELIMMPLEPQETHRRDLEEALPPGYSLIQCVMDRGGMILPLDSEISPFDERFQNGELYHVVLQYKSAQTGNTHEPHYRICYIHRASGERPPSLALQRLYHAVRVADEGSRLAARDEARFSNNEMRIAVAILLATQNRSDDAMDVLRNVDETPEMDPDMARECRGVLREWRRVLAASQRARDAVARASIESDPAYTAIQALRERIIAEDDDENLQYRYLAIRDGYVVGEEGEHYAPFNALTIDADRVELALDKEIHTGPSADFRGGSLDAANRGDRVALNDLVIASRSITPKLRGECTRDIYAALSSPYREKFLAGVDPRCEEVTEFLRAQPVRLRPCDRIITRDGEEWIVRRIAKEHVHFINVEGGAASQNVLPILNFMREVQRCRQAFRFREDDEIIAHNNEMLPKGRQMQRTFDDRTSSRFYRMYGDKTPDGYVAVDCAMDRDGYFLQIATRLGDYEEEEERGEVFYPVFHCRERYSGDINHPHYRFRHIIRTGENDTPGIAVQRMLHSFRRANAESIMTAREEAELTPNENRMAVALVLTMRGRFVEAVGIFDNRERAPVLDAGMAEELRDAIREYRDESMPAGDTRLDRAMHALDIEMRRGPEMIYLVHFESGSSATSATLVNQEHIERIELALDRTIRAGGARQGGLASIDDVNRSIELANNEDTPGAALDWLVGHVDLVRNSFTSPERTQDEIRTISERLRPGLRERFLARAYEWDDWIAEGPSDNALADLVRVSLAGINRAVQDSMMPLVEVHTLDLHGVSEDLWGYPRTCRMGVQLAALYILDRFAEEIAAGRIRIRHARGRMFARTHEEEELEDGIEHDWLIIYIDGEPYYFSFTDGLFGWVSDDERSRAHDEAERTETIGEFEEQFVQEYQNQGFDRPVMLPWREVEHYCRIEAQWDWTGGRDVTANVSRVADVLEEADDDLMEPMLRGLMSLDSVEARNNYFDRTVSSIFLGRWDTIEDSEIGTELAGHIRAAHEAGRLREACPLIRRLVASWAEGEAAQASDCVSLIGQLAEAGPVTPIVRASARPGLPQAHVINFFGDSIPDEAMREIIGRDIEVHSVSTPAAVISPYDYDAALNYFRRVVREAVANGTIPILLGDPHQFSMPLYQALREVYPQLTKVVIDDHTDFGVVLGMREGNVLETRYSDAGFLAYGVREGILTGPDLIIVGAEFAFNVDDFFEDFIPRHIENFDRQEFLAIFDLEQDQIDDNMRQATEYLESRFRGDTDSVMYQLIPNMVRRYYCEFLLLNSGVRLCTNSIGEDLTGQNIFLSFDTDVQPEDIQPGRVGLDLSNIAEEIAAGNVVGGHVAELRVGKMRGRLGTKRIGEFCQAAMAGPTTGTTDLAAEPKPSSTSGDKGETKFPKGSYWAVFDLLWQEGSLTKEEMRNALSIGKSTLDKDLAILGPGRTGNNFNLVTHQWNRNRRANEYRLTDEGVATGELMKSTLRDLRASRIREDLDDAREGVNYLRDVFQGATFDIVGYLDSFENRARALMALQDDELEQLDPVELEMRERFQGEEIGSLRERMEEIARTGVTPVCAFIRAFQETQGSTPEELSEEQRYILETAQTQCPDLDFSPEEIVFCSNGFVKYFWKDYEPQPASIIRLTDGENTAFLTDVQEPPEDISPQQRIASTIYLLIHESMHKKHSPGVRRIRKDEPRLHALYSVLDEGLNTFRALDEILDVCEILESEAEPDEDTTLDGLGWLPPSGHEDKKLITARILNNFGQTEGDTVDAIEAFLTDGNIEPLRDLLGERTFYAIADMLNRQTPETKMAGTYQVLRAGLIDQLLELPVGQREENIDTAMALLQAMGDVLRDPGLEAREDDTVATLGYIPIELEFGLFADLVQRDTIPNRRELGSLFRQAALAGAEALNRQMEAIEVAEADGTAVPPAPRDLADEGFEGGGVTPEIVDEWIEQANGTGELADEALNNLASHVEKDVLPKRRQEQIESISSRLIRRGEFIARTFTVGSLADGMIWPVNETAHSTTYYVVADDLFPAWENIAGVAIPPADYRDYKRETGLLFDRLEDLEAKGVAGVDELRAIIERGDTVLLKASETAKPVAVSGLADSLAWDTTPEEAVMSLLWRENIHRALTTFSDEERQALNMAVNASWIQEVYAMKISLQHTRGLAIGTWKNTDETLSALLSTVRSQAAVESIIFNLLRGDAQFARKIIALWQAAKPGEDAVPAVMEQARKTVAYAAQVTYAAEAPLLVRATPEDAASVETDIRETSDYVWNECIDDKLFEAADSMKGGVVLPIILDLDYLPPGMQRAALEGTGEERIATLSLIRRNLERRLGKNIECRIIPVSGKNKDALLEYANETYKNLEQRQRGKIIQKPLVITTDTKVSSMTNEEVRANNIADITAVTLRPFMTVDGEMQEPFVHTQALIAYAVVKSRLSDDDFRLGKESTNFQKLSRLHEILTGETLSVLDIPPEILKDRTRSALELLIGLPPATRLFDSDQMRDLMRAEEARLRSA